MEPRNRKYLRSSGMDGDKSEESGAFLFSRRVPDFCVGRRSIPTNENSKFVSSGRRRWITLITNPRNCWAPVPLSQINMVSLENLGQTSGGYPIYPQNLGWSAKSKIPDRLGFSRHMKTRLYNGYITVNKEACQNGKAGIIPVDIRGVRMHRTSICSFSLYCLAATDNWLRSEPSEIFCSSRHNKHLE